MYLHSQGHPFVNELDEENNRSFAFQLADEQVKSLEHFFNNYLHS